MSFSCCVAPELDMEQQEKDKAIARQLAEDKKRRKEEIRLLLLGTFLYSIYIHSYHRLHSFFLSFLLSKAFTIFK